MSIVREWDDRVLGGAAAAAMDDRDRLVFLLRRAESDFEDRGYIGLAGLCRQAANHLRKADSEIAELAEGVFQNVGQEVEEFAV